MIKLKDLLKEQESFTATSKKTGNTSTFDSEEARDAAVKAGTHAKIKGKGDSKKGGKDGVNIFGKDKQQSKSKKSEPKKTKSSSSEPDYDKYNFKADTVTDFFKGNLSIDGLQKVAKKNFDSEIADEKDLDGFLNNKFMQDVMADKYGIDKDTLISKVKDLKKALFGGEKDEPNKSSDIEYYDSTELEDKLDNMDLPDDVKSKVDKLAQYLNSQEYELAVAEEDEDDEYADEVENNIQSTRDEIEDLLNKSKSVNENYIKLKKNNIMKIKLKNLLSEHLINEGTRSQIGVIDRSGNIVSTYVHWDGYPDWVGKIAKNHYGGGKIKQLLKVDKGIGISSLNKKMDGSGDHTFQNPGKDQTIFYGRDRGEKGGKFMKGKFDKVSDYIKNAGNQAGAEYVYLYNEKDKKWYFADVYKDKGLKLL